MSGALFHNFDFVAPVYPLLEKASFGNALNEAREAFLERVVGAERILLIGEGNGRFLASLLARKKGGAIEVVDLSPKMLSLLQARIRGVKHSAELNLVCADFLRCEKTPRSFDAIVTHFFLDLFRPETQRQIVMKIASLANPGCVWVNVDFNPAKASLRDRWIDWMQYQFDLLFSGVEADRHYDPTIHILAAGWAVEEERIFCHGNVSAQALIGRAVL